MKKGRNEARAEQRFSAACEGRVEPTQLLCEIEPLIEDYFIGNFEIVGQTMRIDLLNGQRFVLKIEEV